MKERLRSAPLGDSPAHDADEDAPEAPAAAGDGRPGAEAALPSPGAAPSGTLAISTAPIIRPGRPAPGAADLARQTLAAGGAAGAGAGAGAHELYAELLGHDAVQALTQVQSTRRYAYLALCELLLRKSFGLENGTTAAAGVGDAAAMAARCVVAAAEVAELLDLEVYGAPVVQDVRAIAWTYFTGGESMQEDMRTAEVSRRLAARLLAGSADRAPGRPSLLAAQAALAGHCGHFGESLRLLTGAAGCYRRTDQAHLAARFLLKKGMALGNAGETQAAVRLLWRGLDTIEPAREPRLLVWATHNLAWFLHEAGRTGQAASCIEAARKLYRAARDRREMSRLRWLEGKLAADFGTAETALAEARDGLAREGLAYEAALAAMDLAVRYAGERQAARMRQQADGMLALFRSDSMYGETVFAMRSFREHGGGDDPSDLLRDLTAYLDQARRPQNPKALAASIPP